MKPRIVLVDDDGESCRALRELLEADGFEAVAFENAEAAWAAITSGEVQPDVVLADVRMPGLDGVGLLHRIRSRFTRLPVILMSAFADEKIWVEALEAGAFDVFPKPIRAAPLIRVLQAAVTEGSTAIPAGGTNLDPRSPGVLKERSCP